MRELSLGISPCPNDVFIFAGMLLGEVGANDFRFRTEFEDVETLNGRAQRGELDVAKISYANFVRCVPSYVLLSSGGALGRGVGPLLLSHGGEWNPDAPVLVPGEYTTANFLLDFWAQRPLTKEFLPFDALYDTLCRVPGAQGVVIHEKRFTYAADGLTLLQDLGSAWEAQTGFGIPLGAIVARTELPANVLDDLVRRSLRWSRANFDRAFALCREYSQDMNPDVVRAHIDLYVNDFSDTLGPEGEAAVAFFLDQQRRFLA